MNARIEIDIIATNRKALSDRTSQQVRGLNHTKDNINEDISRSHPTMMRESKWN